MPAMSTETIVTTFSDLYGALLTDMRSATSASATTSLAKRYIDTGNMELYVGFGERFHWAERHAFLKTHPEYTTGTLTATIGSGTITGDSTEWNTANSHGQTNMREDGRIVIGSGNVVYDVSAVASDTSATINPTYIGDSDSELTYRYFEDEYDLASDFLRPLDQRSFDNAGTIRLLGRTDFRRRFPRNWIPTSGIRFAIIEDKPFSGNTTPVRRIRFGPPPSTIQVIPYSYVTKNIVVASDGTEKASFTADTDEPTMPLSFRNFILKMAKVAWYRELKDDARSLAVFQELQGDIDRMIGSTDIGAQKLRIVTPWAKYRARATSPYTRRGRKYDLNGRFDRFED
jgi:hypothetical protein